MSTGTEYHATVHGKPSLHMYYCYLLQLYCTGTLVEPDTVDYELRGYIIYYDMHLYYLKTYAIN